MARTWVRPMTTRHELEGWAWFEPPAAREDDPAEAELCRAFARCFAGSDGQLVMEHLERVILNRRLAAHVSDAELRHLEGQRHAVAYIATMVARGRA